jgi:hypothetical protein
MKTMPTERLLNLIRKQYKENEENNSHAENFLLLASHFGTDDEVWICERNVDFRDKFGYVNHELSGAAYKVANHYYNNLI